MNQLLVKIGCARMFLLAATLLLIAGPAAPQAMACGGDADTGSIVVDGELPGGG